MKKENSQKTEPKTREEEFDFYLGEIKREVIMNEKIDLKKFAEAVEYIAGGVSDLARTGRFLLTTSLIDYLGDEEHLFPEKQSLENFAYMLQCIEDCRK